MERPCETQTEDDLKVFHIPSLNIIIPLIVIPWCNYCKQMRPCMRWLVVYISLHLSEKHITVVHVNVYFFTGEKVETQARPFSAWYTSIIVSISSSQKWKPNMLWKVRLHHHWLVHQLKWLVTSNHFHSLTDDIFNAVFLLLSHISPFFGAGGNYPRRTLIASWILWVLLQITKPVFCHI